MWVSIIHAQKPSRRNDLSSSAEKEIPTNDYWHVLCCSYKWQMPSSYAFIMDSVSYVIIVLGSSESSTLRRLLCCTGVDGGGVFLLGTLLKRTQMLLVLDFLLCMITKLIKECIKFLIITNNGEGKLYQRCCQFGRFELHNSLPLFGLPADLIHSYSQVEKNNKTREKNFSNESRGRKRLNGYVHYG